jgi:hypothetical protein
VVGVTPLVEPGEVVAVGVVELGTPGVVAALVTGAAGVGATGTGAVVPAVVADAPVLSVAEAPGSAAAKAVGSGLWIAARARPIWPAGRGARNLIAVGGGMTMPIWAAIRSIRWSSPS